MKEVLRLEYVDKWIGAQQVLQNLHLNLFSGEIIGILVRDELESRVLSKILYGQMHADSGYFYVNDQQMQLISPIAASQVGINAVLKQSQLVAKMPLYENLFEVRAGSYKKPLLRKKLKIRETHQMIEETTLNHIMPEEMVSALSTFEQYIMQIQKASMFNAKIIVVENISEEFSESENQVFQALLLKKRALGLSIVLLFDKYDNAFNLLDRLFVMRQGTIISILYPDEMSASHIYPLLSFERPAPIMQKKETGSNQLLLECKKINTPFDTNDLTFKLHVGESLGVFDYSGSADHELIEILIGEKAFSGYLKLKSKEFIHLSERKLKRNHIGFIPYDLDSCCLFNNLSVQENIMLMSNSNLSNFGLLNKRIEKYLFDQCMLQIKDIDTLTQYRNFPLPYFDKRTQMKLCIARWIVARCDILIIQNPFSWYDDLTINELIHLLNVLKSNGIATIITSPTINNLSLVCDQILKINEPGECISR